MQTLDKARFTSEVYQSHAAFWRKQMCSSPSGFYFRQKLSNTEGGTKTSYQYTFTSEVQQALTKVMNGNRMALFTTLVSMFAIALKRYTQLENVWIHTPLLKNDATGIHNPTVPLLFFVDECLSLREYLNTSKLLIKESYRFQNYPLLMTNEDNNVEAYQSNILLYDDFLHDHSAEEGNYDLMITLPFERNGIIITYNTQNFAPAFISNIASHLNELLFKLQHLDEPIKTMSMLSQREEQLLHRFNPPMVPFSDQVTLQELLEKAALANSSATALVSSSSRLTYGELNRQVNTLAHYLRSQWQITRQEPVGLLMKRSENLVITLLAILKAGGCYVPIDITYPDERKRLIMDDVQMRICLTDLHVDEKVVNPAVRLVQLPVDKELRGYSEENPFLVNAPEDLAYIIYTSGSSGKPKGVMIEHRSVVNIIEGLVSSHKPRPDWKYLLTSSISFDASVKQIFIPILLNAEMHLFLEQGEIGALQAYIDSEKINALHLSPSLWEELLLVSSEKGDSLSTLEYISSGGEQLSRTLAARLSERFSGKLIWNLYGPTETCINAAGGAVSLTDEREAPTLGKPLPNTQVYILDNSNRLSPIGVWGEICVGGKGVARGYLNQREKTSSSFIANRFAQAGTLYKTGDRGRWLTSGEIEFGGRLDRQVKRRGVRIELAELEHALTEHPLIDWVFIQAEQHDEAMKIVAYYRSQYPFMETELKKHLLLTLPTTMLPDHFISVESVPVTRHGKVDVSKLPSREESSVGRSNNVPKTPTEEKLYSVWQQLLGITSLTTDDDFFQLGGHSLKAIRLSALISKEWNIELSLEDIFLNPTITALATRIDSSTTFRKAPMRAIEEQEYYSLSPGQRRLWITHYLENAAAAYNMVDAYRCSGLLDVDALRNAFKALVDRHENLRSVFIKVQDEPKVKIVPADLCRTELFLTDLTAASESEQILQQLISKEANTDFDLEIGSLVRMQAFRMSENHHVLLFSLHHIISDGWSSEVLVRDLVTLYNSMLLNTSAELPVLNVQYKDYASWVSKDRNDGEMNRQREFWMKEFAEPYNGFRLFSDRVNPTVRNYNGGTVQHDFKPEVFTALKSFSATHKMSDFVVLLSCVYLLLNRYTSQNDIVIGTPVSGRQHPELENQVGFFINYLPIRLQTGSAVSFSELVTLVRQRTFDTFANQLYPYDELVRALGLEGNADRSALFNVAVIMQQRALETDFLSKMKELQLTPIQVDIQGNLLDLKIDFCVADNGAQIAINYNANIFSRHQMEKFVVHFQNLLEGCLKNASVPVRVIPFLSATEKEQLLVSFNAKRPQIMSHQKPLHQFLEQWAEEQPQRIALLYNDLEVTYQELNQQANTIAWWIRAQDSFKPGEVVGVMLERSPELIAALYGILKSGCAYLPIDPVNPVDRKKYLIEDSGLKLLITRNTLSSSLFDPDDLSCPQVVDVTEIAAFTSASNINPPNIGTLRDLAYVIYTSGSTGNPKGVMVEHGNIVSMLVDQVELFEITPPDRLLQFAPITFDASIYEIGIALCGGATLVLISQEVIQDKDQFVDYLNGKKVSWMVLPPSYLSLLDASALSSLRILITAGETPHTKMVAECVKHFRYYNAYGPTECSVCVTDYEVTTDDLSVNIIPIGYPTGNVSLYVTDSHLNLLPAGVIGELCVGGKGVARGYLGKAQLTAEKFVDNPFIVGERLFRTGDLVRWRDNGALEFVGREDTQVKFRGLRIELGEIEYALLRHPDVTNALVIMYGATSEQKQLIAYITGDTLLNEEIIHHFLTGILPPYMLPSSYMVLTAFPLTSHGKIDRAKLPIPGAGRRTERQNAATDPTEIAVANIVKEVLGVLEIYPNDNFFLKGGDSLKAIKLLSRIHRDFDMRISYAALFSDASVAHLGRLIRKGKQDRFYHIDQVTHALDYPASFAQRSLWMQEQVADQLTMNVISVAYVFAGVFNPDAFADALEHLIERHEILRTKFLFQANELRQHVYPFAKDILEVDTLRLKRENDLVELNQLVTEASSKPFDLQSGRLMRVRLITINPTSIAFVLTLHHMITDEWSMNVFANELLARYQQIVDGIESNVTPLRIQYRDFAVWQSSQWNKGMFNTAEQYWLKTFETPVATLNFPTDYDRPLVSSVLGQEYTFDFPERITDGLRQMTHRHKATLFITLLATVKMLLHRYTDEQDIVVGTPVSGRIHVDLEDQIGFYINILALRTSVTDTETFESLLEKVKRTFFDAFEHQHYPFDQLVNKLKWQNEGRSNPLFDIMVVLQGEQLNDKSLPFLPGLSITPLERPALISKYDLTFGFTDTSDKITCHLLYKKELFMHETIIQITNNYLALLESIIANQTMPLQLLNGVTERERTQILHEFNSPIREAENATIPMLLASSVRNFPRRIALKFGSAVYDYRALDEQSNRLANYLRSKWNIGSGKQVAIVGDSSDWFVMAMIAVLKTGACYIPIDERQPKARIVQIVSDAGTAAMLTDQTMSDEFLTFNPINVMESWAEIGHYVTEPLQTTIQSEDPAYVIYTSGTTGVPKGVVITHRGLANLCLWHQKYFNVSEESRATQFASVSFDAAGWEIWPYLLCGASLYPVPDEIKLELSSLRSFLMINHISHCFLPTKLYEQMDFSGLEKLTVLTGGERLRAVNPTHTSVFNNYGPTEFTVVATAVAVEQLPNDKTITIGKPILNTQAYIVNNGLQLQPVGVEGELCLAGAGIASGYLNREEMTREKFVTNPFLDGTQLYRTGDRAKWLRNGEIQFVGRKDFQVKIRGFRIELSEIEYALARHHSVKETVVLVDGDQEFDQHLIAFYRSEEILDRETLSAFLEASLPHYMIPQYFVLVQNWPLTVTGKVDAEKLLFLAKGVCLQQHTERSMRSFTDGEAVVIEAFEKVLQVEGLSQESNFFDLGGDSIKAIQIVSRIRNAGYRLAVKDIFQYPLISRVALHLQKAASGIERVAFSGEVRLTPIQADFFGSNRSFVNHFNQAVMWFSPERLDDHVIEKVFNVLLQEHDMLRAVYNYESEQVVQWVSVKVTSCVKVYEAGTEIEREAALIQQSIDLKNGPLIKVALFHGVDGDRLLMAIHHLVIDGISWRILFEDISNLYEALVRGHTYRLPARTDSFKVWSERLWSHASSEVLMNEKAYWIELEHQSCQPLSKDFNSGAGRSADTNTLSISLSQADTTDLLTGTNRAFNTEINDILIASLAITVKKVFGLESFRFDMEGHGREEMFKDITLTRTVGWFTVIYPVVINAIQLTDLSKLIKSVKECLRRTPSNGIGYGILKYLTPASLKTELSFGPNADVLFNYLGQFDQDIRQTRFDFAKESVGNSIHPSRERTHPIEISGLVLGGELHLSITYSPGQFRTSTMDQLLTAYNDSLLQLVSHCRDYHTQELTPSDFAYKGLSMTDLDSLNSIF